MTRRATILALAALALLGASCSASGSTASTSATTPTTAASTTLPATTEAPTTAPPTTGATTTTTTPPLLRTPTPEEPLVTLIMGDSTAYEVGNGVLRANTDGLLAAQVLFKTSSGITRDDFFDWAYYLGWIADTNPPELMILSLGANDGQDLHSPDGNVHVVGEPGWRAEYLRRVEEISRHLSDAGTTVYWVGQPLAADPVYSGSMEIVNGVYAEVAASVDHVEFVDIWPILAGPDGGYRRTAPGPDGAPVDIRAEDDIHLTDAGADLAAGVVVAQITTGWER